MASTYAPGSSDEEDQLDQADTVQGDDGGTEPVSSLPDLSYVNRTPPYLEPPRQVPFPTPISHAALFGETLVVTAQEKLRILMVRRGAQFDKTAQVPSTERVVPLATEHYAFLGEPPQMSAQSRELRVTALAFTPSVQVGDAVYEQGRFVWYGTAAGHLGEVDTQSGRLTCLRTNVHKAPIILLERLGHAMVAMDDSGRISTWVPRASPVCLASTAPETTRILLPKQAHVSLAGHLLWVCHAVPAPRGNSRTSHKKVLVQSYSPITDHRPFTTMTQPGEWRGLDDQPIGAVTCSGFVPTTPDVVYFGHESGHVTVWTHEGHCLEQVPVASEPITCMAGALDHLWTASPSGRIRVSLPGASLREVRKAWLAHRAAVSALLFDPYGFLPHEPFVASVGDDLYAAFWDATLRHDWMSAEVSRCEASFSMYRSLRVLATTYNLGAASPDDMFGTVENMDLFHRILRSASTTATAPHGSPSTVTPDVVVFAFQELVDLEDKRKTAKRLLFNKHRRTKDHEMRERQPSRVRAWIDKLESSVRVALLDAPYSLLLAESMIGLFTCIFIRSDLVARTREVHSYMVKTGLGGRYGNKGAIVSRFILDDSSFCVVNCHLAAGQRNVRQRNRDVTDIMQSASTAPTQPYEPAFAHGGDGRVILDHETCLWLGDMNYRLDLTRDWARTLVRQQRYADLVAADQLLQELRHNPAFRLRSFHEAPIHFPPSYKFDRASHEYDTSEKARVPAYCDRILYHGHLPGTIQCLSYKRWDATISDHRPVSATFKARVKFIDQDLHFHVLERTRADFELHRDQLGQQCSQYYQSM